MGCLGLMQEENEPLFDEDDIDQLFVTLKQMNSHLEVMRRIMVIQFGIIATMFTLGILFVVLRVTVFVDFDS
jgi:hypothetical protein